MSDTVRSAFSLPRFVTRGVVQELDPQLIFTMWKMVDLLCEHGNVEPDCLQVFELESANSPNGGFNQTITHRQECPPYVAMNSLPMEKAVTATVFVIEDGSHAPMMLAEEY